MNELQIFVSKEFGQIRTVEENRKEFMGFFYVIEYGDLLKIGSTKNPYQRLSQIKRQALKYADIKTGNIAISKQHTNYRDNESKIHKLLSDYRKEGTELFNISFEMAVNVIENSDIEYENKSDEIDKRATDFLNGMKKFLLGGTL